MKQIEGRDMKILMLGGTGAMGSCLSDLLLGKKEYEIWITSRKPRSSFGNIEFICGDAHNIEFIESVLNNKYFDVIVDFMQYDYSDFIEHINIFLPKTFQYIYFSSSRVYADNYGKKICERHSRLYDVCEDKDFIESNEYAILKAKEENALINSHHKNWTIIRPYITYNDHRLQLGVFEKEEWLYRALKGRSILFPASLENKLTTLTSGKDVAKILYYIIGNKDALSEVYQIASDKALTWGEVLSIYVSALEEIIGGEIKVKKDYNQDKVAIIKGNAYQLKYDRMYDRKFDSSKILGYLGDDFDFIVAEDGLRESIQNFMKGDQQFGYISGKMEAVFDIIANEYTPLKDIPGVKEKIKYLITRFTPFIYFKYHFILK